MAGERVVLPIFPLGIVLFPGMLLPLNVFEDRYRALVRDLLAQPADEGHRFGVVAIRQGHEVGPDAVSALYDIGTLATVTRVLPRPDGQFELVTVGTERFRLGALDHSKPYLQAEIEILDEQVLAGSDGAEGPAVTDLVAAFRSYVSALGAARGTNLQVPDLPKVPALLSWLVAASAVVDLPIRQHLLEIDGTVGRLAAELELLRGETNILKRLGSAPAPYLAHTRQNLN